MCLKTSFLLISLILCIHSEDLEHESIPVFLLGVKNVVIDGYHGIMDAKTMELLGNVEILALRNCNLTMFNDNSMHSLKNLRKMTISNSHYDRTKDDVSECCKKLLDLEIMESNIGAIEEDLFKKVAGVKALERFCFHKMNVPLLKTDSLSGSNLKELEIHHSKLGTIEDGALNGMDKLEVLNLKYNNLKSVPTRALAAVKTLKELNLEGNLIEKITTADFPSLPNLEILDLGHNPIKEIDLKGLKEKLPNIQKVGVSGIDIDPSKAEGVPLHKL